MPASSAHPESLLIGHTISEETLGLVLTNESRANRPKMQRNGSGEYTAFLGPSKMHSRKPNSPTGRSLQTLTYIRWLSLLLQLLERAEKVDGLLLAISPDYSSRGKQDWCNLCTLLTAARSKSTGTKTRLPRAYPTGRRRDAFPLFRICDTRSPDERFDGSSQSSQAQPKAICLQRAATWARLPFGESGGMALL